MFGPIRYGTKVIRIRTCLVHTCLVLTVLAACEGSGEPVTPMGVVPSPRESADGGEDASEFVIPGAQVGFESPDAEPHPLAGAVPKLRFPIADENRDLISPTFRPGVDHDPVDRGIQRVECRDFEGRPFPFCYDGHTGTDFMLRGGFRIMDAGSAGVVAAAGGLVTRVIDGEYDRCHANAATADIDCDGHPIRANRVQIEHANGWVTEYLHLMRGSALVREGDAVSCGAALARIGSSGRSSAPHLHFELHAPNGRPIDPFAGPFSQTESLWTQPSAEDTQPGGVCDPAWR